MEKQTLNLDGCWLVGDEWKAGGNTLIKDEDTYTDSSWPGCDYRVKLENLGINIGVNVKITGKKRYYVLAGYRMRARIEYVGDGEPSTFGGGWIYFNE